MYIDDNTNHINVTVEKVMRFCYYYYMGNKDIAMCIELKFTILFAELIIIINKACNLV